MANVDVDKRAKQPGYQSDLIKFRNLREELAPLIAEYRRIKDPGHQAAWLEKDDLLAEALDFCKKVETGKDAS